MILGYKIGGKVRLHTGAPLPRKISLCARYCAHIYTHATSTHTQARANHLHACAHIGTHTRTTYQPRDLRPQAFKANNLIFRPFVSVSCFRFLFPVVLYQRLQCRFQERLKLYKPLNKQASDFPLLWHVDK